MKLDGEKVSKRQLERALRDRLQHGWRAVHQDPSPVAAARAAVRDARQELQRRIGEKRGKRRGR